MTKRGRKPTYSEEIQNRAINLVKEGKKIEEVSTMMSIPYLYIYRWLRKTNTTLVNKGHHGRPQISDEIKLLVIERLDRGDTLLSVAKDVGICISSVQKIKNYFNGKIKDPNEKIYLRPKGRPKFVNIVTPSNTQTFIYSTKESIAINNKNINNRLIEINELRKKLNDEETKLHNLQLDLFQ